MNRQGFLEHYQESHRHPVNRALHTIGIPTIVLSIPMLWLRPWIGIGMFAGGWVLQFVGHAFEGKPPAFFTNPIYLLVGPVWAVKKVFGRP